MATKMLTIFSDIITTDNNSPVNFCCPPHKVFTRVSGLIFGKIANYYGKIIIIMSGCSLGKADIVPAASKLVKTSPIRELLKKNGAERKYPTK